MLSVAAVALLFAWLKALLYPGPPAAVIAPGPPAAVIAAPTFRFGTMPQNAKGRHAFAFKNDGGSPLRLVAARTSGSKYDIYILVNGKKVYPVEGAVMIPPGGSEDVFLEWETRRFQGRFYKGVKFLTNDPTRPWVDLIVEGTVTK